MTAQVQDTCGDGRTRRTSISKNVLQVRYVPSLAVGYPERTAVSLQVCLWSGLRPSAIRYYEQIGILPPAQRVSGQRRYDLTALHRLVVIQRARQTGFTLTEIKQLFFGFRAGTPPFSPLAEVEEAEDCRTGCDVGAYPDYARPFRAAGKMPLRGT